MTSPSRFTPRNLVVQFAIWVCLPLIGALAAWQIYSQVVNGRPTPPRDEGLIRLALTMPGTIIDVPRDGGLHVAGDGASNWLMLGGRISRQPTLIDLCDQRSQSNEAPDRLLPILVRASWQEVQSLTSHRPRSPLILPPGVAEGFPRMDITGEAAEFHLGGTLRLSVPGKAAQWQLMSDVVANATSSSREIAREAWLLWKSAAKTAEATSPGSYDVGLRVQRIQDSECPAGQLRLSLYTASSGQLTTDQRLPVFLFPRLGGSTEIHLLPGRHEIPGTVPAPVEDQELFDTTAAKGMIRLEGNGRLAVAPSDLPQAALAGVKPAAWGQVVMDDKTRALFHRLYAKADGAYVRAQVRRYNQAAQWAAIRVRLNASTEATLADGQGLWRAYADGLAVPVTAGLPAVAARLFDTPSSGHGPWLRVATWPETGARQVRFSLTPKTDMPSMELLVLGKPVKADGAKLADSTSACLGPACTAPDMMNRVVLSGLRAGVPASLTLVPDARFAALARGDAEFNPIRVAGERLEWRASTTAHGNQGTPPAKVAIVDRAGVTLFQDGLPTEAARAANLTPLVGISADDSHSVAGVLGRLSDQGRATATARLSVDAGWQSLAQTVVTCVGIQGRTWDSASGACGNRMLDDQRDPSPGPGRRAGLLVLDAGTGEILLSAGAPAVPEQTQADELIAFDRFNPSHSPLRLWNWQHDGGLEHTTGSAFKLVSALGFEHAATRSPALNALLEGRSSTQINAHAAARGEAYDSWSGCYPGPCGKKTDVKNDKEHRPADYAQNDRFGLREALAHSINTWFAWLAEQSDITLASGADYHLALPISNHGLDSQRPIFSVAHRLGFEHPLRLDDGLLPADFRWQSWDALQAMPSTFDPLHDRHNVRQHAIGLRAQVTPLQMALVAAAIGEGRIVHPRLLIGLDGNTAKPVANEPLDLRLDRIRAGMAEVVKTGTADGVFRASGPNPLRDGIFGKTGTAPMSHLGQKPKLYMAWFVGYIEPGTLPGERRRLAFAAWVSRTQLYGGQHAAPMVSAWMEEMIRQAGLSKAAHAG